MRALFLFMAQALGVAACWFLFGFWLRMFEPGLVPQALAALVPLAVTAAAFPAVGRWIKGLRDFLPW